MTTKSIYELDLHEFTEVKIGPITYIVTKVVGGWIYSNHRLDHNTLSEVFVPCQVNREPRRDWMA